MGIYNADVVAKPMVAVAVLCDAIDGQVIVAKVFRETLINSAQLCASAAGFQNKAVMAGNGQPFSTSPTMLWRPAARARRGAPESSSSVSPIFAIALLERQTGFVIRSPLAIHSGHRIIQRFPSDDFTPGDTFTV
jgi:hypothetical protein